MMSFQKWIYSVYPPDSAINGRWGTLHILTLVACFAIILLIAFIFKNKSEKTKQNVILVLAGFILLFELSRRAINLSRGYVDTQNLLVILLPRPWCAISCWLMMASSVVKKRWFYNFASMNALLNAIIFFAYPAVGFNHKVILFENLYSITTHALLLVSSISLMTLGLTGFKIKKDFLLKEIISLILVFAYAFIEIFVLKIESDPMYFMKNNDVQAFLGVDYNLYLVIYVVFLAFYFSLFHLIQRIIDKRKKAD